MSNKLRFAHLADLHLGGWREKRLTQLNFESFSQAIRKIIETNYDFVLFAGDIFNNAMPPLDLVQKVILELMKLKKLEIPVYVIGGSHDYSTSGKSFIELLDSAGVFVDVGKWKQTSPNSVELKFTQTDHLNISGIIGKRNGLDKNIYDNLENQQLPKDKLNIFMFHTTLSDFKPDFMKAVKTQVKSSFLPKGFDYYAGGHVHTFIDGTYSTGRLSYPGPLFPNNFSELKREKPSFLDCTFDLETRKLDNKRIYLTMPEKLHIEFNFDKEHVVNAKEIISEKLSKFELKDKIVLLEFSGVVDGRISELELSKVMINCYDKNALHVLKNTYKLTSLQVSVEEIPNEMTQEDVENELIKKNIEISEQNTVKKLFSLELEKLEGEKNAQHEARIIEAFSKVLKL